MRRLPFLLLFALFLAACQARAGNEPASPQPLRTIRLPMGFIADPQYAPFYVAVDRGYFAAEGLALDFDYSFETDGMALVGAGELPFAVVSGEQVLLARAQGLPVVYVLEWFQKYPIAVVSKASAGIQTPADLIGKQVGLPAFFGASYVGYVGLLSANGLSQQQVEASDIGFTQVESLLTDKAQAVVGYANNEPVQLAARGEAINVIYVSDYIDMVANGLITNEKTIAEDPALVEAFVRAMLHGLKDTLDDPDAAFEISKKFVEGLDDSRRPVLDASLEMWRAGTLGLSDLSSWQTTEEVLLQTGLLDAPLPELNAVFDNRFVLSQQPK